MVNETQTSDPELTEHITTQIRRALEGYGVGVNESGAGGYHVRKSSRRQTENGGTEVHEFEILVDMVHRLDLKEVMEEQGLLIWCRNGVEIEIRGFDTEGQLVDVTYYLPDSE